MIEATNGGIAVSVRVIPRAGTSGVAGTRAGALLVRVRAPPVDGAANSELVEVLATALAVPRRAVSILSGLHSRLKRVGITGPDLPTATTRLLALIG